MGLPDLLPASRWSNGIRLNLTRVKPEAESLKEAQDQYQCGQVEEHGVAASGIRRALIGMKMHTAGCCNQVKPFNLCTIWKDRDRAACLAGPL